MTSVVRRVFRVLPVALLTACPPPEVLYGPEIYEDPSARTQAPSDAVPNLPSGHGVAQPKAVKLLRLEKPQSSKVGPSPEAVATGPHVEFSGTLVCDGCVEQLMVHVVALGPAGRPPPRGTLAGGQGRSPLVSAKVSPGPFTVPVPIVDSPVAIEFLVDANADGVPSVGERYARWLDPDAPISANTTRSDFILDASDRPTGRDERVRGAEGIVHHPAP